MCSICLAVLCGLPASGKSNLCQQLLKYSENGDKDLPYKFIVIEYDELLPAETEKTLIETRGAGDEDVDGLSPWKLYRQHIYNCIDLLISMLKHPDITLQTGCSSDTVNTELWKKIVEKHMPDSLHICDGRPVCVVIDDNMYYRSMRYTYYQLARKYNTGFCQIYLQTSVEAALEQNRQRSVNSVTDETIILMAKRLEEPKPFKNAWEQHTLTLSYMPDVNDTCRQFVYQIIEQALLHPVEGIADDIEATLQARDVCSASFLHQTDQILRKLVSLEMGKGKESGLGKAELPLLAANLQLVRKHVIDGLGEGEILVPQNIKSMATDAAKDQSSALFVFLKDLFYQRKNEIVIKNGNS